MAVDVSKIPNNDKFDPVRKALLNLQSQLEQEGQIAYDGQITIQGGTNMTDTPTQTFTVNQSGNSTITLNADSQTDENFTTALKNKLDGIEAGAEVNTVDSVNTQTGAVVLDADDISDATTTNKFTTQAEIDKLAGIEAGAQVNTVDSVNGQTGTVLLDTDDIDEGAINLYYTDGRVIALVDKAFVDALNVDADTLDSLNSTDFTLDYVVSQNDTTVRAISIGSLEIGGVPVIDSDRKFIGRSTISETVPVFTFTGDTNTGVGRTENNKVGLIAEGVMALEASQTGVDVLGDLTVIGSLTADGIVLTNDIITSAAFTKVANRFKLELTQADGSTIEASMDDIVLANALNANYIPYVLSDGGDGDTINPVLDQSFLKLNGSTLELDWGDTIGVYIERNLKMRKDGGGFGKYYEATYAADSISLLHYNSSSDIDTAKLGATTTGRLRVNDAYSLPVGDGTAEQVLYTNGFGDLYWDDLPPEPVIPEPLTGTIGTVEFNNELPNVFGTEYTAYIKRVLNDGGIIESIDGLYAALSEPQLYAIHSNNFKLDSAGNASFSGRISNATGIFSGDIAPDSGVANIYAAEAHNVQTKYDFAAGRVSWVMQISQMVTLSSVVVADLDTSVTSTRGSRMVSVEVEVAFEINGTPKYYKAIHTKNYTEVVANGYEMNSAFGKYEEGDTGLGISVLSSGTKGQVFSVLNNSGTTADVLITVTVKGLFPSYEESRKYIANSLIGTIL